MPFPKWGAPASKSSRPRRASIEGPKMGTPSVEPKEREEGLKNRKDECAP